MKLIFRIQYRTLWGEEVRIIFDEDENQSASPSCRNSRRLWLTSVRYEFTSQH